MRDAQEIAERILANIGMEGYVIEVEEGQRLDVIVKRWENLTGQKAVKL